MSLGRSSHFVIKLQDRSVKVYTKEVNWKFDRGRIGIRG